MCPTSELEGMKALILPNEMEISHFKNKHIEAGAEGTEYDELTDFQINDASELYKLSVKDEAFFYDLVEHNLRSVLPGDQKMKTEEYVRKKYHLSLATKKEKCWS